MTNTGSGAHHHHHLRPGPAGGDGAIGLITAGQPLTSELMVGFMVFGVPVAALVLFMTLNT
jgi:hypothetical protein